MSHPVHCFPGAILCGKCGKPMRQENIDQRGKEAQIQCWNSHCEQYEVVLKFPAQVIELERAEA
jgi:hypothetical protein